MRIWKIAPMVAVMSATMAMSVFAGEWKTADNGKWWYDNGDGSYTSNGWQWIDGNGDGVAESYYFDGNGYLLTNTTTPDGYTVDENGVWKVNGVVQTKTVSAATAPISEADFVVSGDNSVTRGTSDHSIITNWIRVGYNNDPTPYHIFVTGDSLTTARGISLGDSKNSVVEKYGNNSSQGFNAGSDKWYQFSANNGNAEASVVATSASVLEYTTAPYGIRFYFDAQDKLIGVIYFRDGGVTESSASNVVKPNEGYYFYYTTDIYDNDSQKMIHKGEYHFTDTWSDNALDVDRYPFGLDAEPVTMIKIMNVTDNSFKVYYDEYPEYEQYFNENSAYDTFYRDGEKWRLVGGDGTDSYYWVINDSDTFTLYHDYNKLNPETEEVLGHYKDIRTYKRVK